MRDTHLVLGLFGCLFLLMYGVSSVQMAHNRWFKPSPKVSESNVEVAKGADAREVARELMDKHGMRGEIAQVRKTEDGWDFRVQRPGTVYEVVYVSATGEAKVRENVANFIGMLNRIHHIQGLWHDYGLTNVWGALVGVISASLFVLGGTGIYLWFKIHKERRIGAVLLTLSLGYSLTLIVLLRTA